MLEAVVEWERQSEAIQIVRGFTLRVKAVRKILQTPADAPHCDGVDLSRIFEVSLSREYGCQLFAGRRC